MENNIKKELNEIKYLFNYKKGVVISEQPENTEDIDNIDFENIDFGKLDAVPKRKETELGEDNHTANREINIPVKPDVDTPVKPKKPGTPYSPKPGPKKNPKAENKKKIPNWLTFNSLGIDI
jgi:hypothetical protein